VGDGFRRERQWEFELELHGIRTGARFAPARRRAAMGRTNDGPARSNSDLFGKSKQV
jgi:hypothetical protein